MTIWLHDVVWFDATPEEQVAVFDLVDEVKRARHRELRPDGYDVGSNAGAAAGQVGTTSAHANGPERCH